MQNAASIATVLASLIGAGISFITLTLAKEQKTSEFRQAWIDALRGDLASFFTSSRALLRIAQELGANAERPTRQVLSAFTEEDGSKMRIQIADAMYRIKFRLNPDESDHEELLRLIETSKDKTQTWISTGEGLSEAEAAIERAAGMAPPLLKKEWERVKRGEPAFRLVRNWIAPAVIVLVLWFSFATSR